MLALSSLSHRRSLTFGVILGYPGHLVGALLILLCWIGMFFAPLAGIAQTAGAGSGSRGTIALSPAEIYVGHVIVGQTKPVSCSLVNTGAADAIITTTTVTSSAFRVLNLILPKTLSAGQSVTLTIQFAPKAIQYVSASLVFTSNALNPNTALLLHGTGVQAGTLAAIPPTVFFGKVPSHASKHLSVVVKNVGYSNVTLSRESLTGMRFSLRGLQLPLTLTPAGSVTFGAIFTPSTEGVLRGSLSLTSSATNPTLTIPIFGTGTVNVSLSWTASASAVGGYNVYRSRIPGGPYHELTSALDVNTSYRDIAVLGGQTYYYVVTSVSPNGVEGSYSTQARVVVPGP